MRRGQLTLFVIVGLVLLLIVGIFLLMKQPPEHVELRPELSQLNTFVEQCLAATGKNAIKTVGLHGGYAPDTMPLHIEELPTPDSQVLVNEPQRVPLWHEVHNCDNPEGCIGDNRPRLCSRNADYCPLLVETGSDTSFQESIEHVTEEQIRECLGTFSPLPTLVVAVEGTPEVRALIRDDDVHMTLELPLTVTTSDGATTQVDTFTTSLPVELALSYELATNIYALERQETFMENLFLHLLSLYSGIDQPIPPVKTLQLQGGQKTWVKRDVERVIEHELMPFMNFIQVMNAEESYVPLVSPGVDERYQAYADGTLDYLTIRLRDIVTYPLGVQVQYLQSPINLDINGKEFLKPRKMPGTGFLSIIGGLKVLEYRFKYSASYPLLFKVTDSRAFSGEGFELHFGLEANIRKNHPLNTSRELTLVRFPETTFDALDEAQLVDHTYTVTVGNSLTGDRQEDIGITYVCGSQYQMGITNEQGVWTGKLPYCIVGGALVAESFEFLGTGVDLNNFEEDGGSTELTLGVWPRRDVNARLFKRSPQDIQALGAGVTPAGSQTHRTPLRVNENVVLTVQRVKKTPYESEAPLLGILKFGEGGTRETKEDRIRAIDELFQSGAISQEDYEVALEAINNAGDPAPSLETQQIDLVPGEYEVTAFLTYYGNITIPEEERCAGGLLGECYTLPAQNMSSWISGGVILVDADVFTVTAEELYASDTVDFFVLEQPIPRNWTALQEHQNMEDYQTYERKRMIRPEFTLLATP